MQLDPRATAAGVRLVVHEVLGSTNAEALELARRGRRGPLWVVAGRQTAGRGRRGRAWISHPGNLYASLLLTGASAAEHWPELSLVAALALYDAIAAVAPRLESQLAIKWPNDLLLAGAKFAGVLIEGEGGDGGGAVVIGIGVNCASHPAETDYPATDLATANVSPATVFAALSATMLGRLEQWNGGRGFTTIRTDWLRRAAGLGQDMRVRLADREFVGRFEALDQSGALVLRLPDGSSMTIPAADVLMSAGQH